MPGKIAPVLCAALLGSGCVSISMAQTARALEAGVVRAGVTTTLVVETPPGNNTATTVAVPVPEVTVRYGLGSGTDLGLKGGPLGTVIDLKKELVNNGNFVLSVAPGGGLLYASTNLGSGGSSSQSATAITFQLPLLFGIALAGGHEVVFGPRLAELVQYSSPSSGPSQTTAATVLGGGFGVAIKIGQTARLLPELNLASKIAGDGPNGGIGFQFGLGVLFGG